MRHRCPGTWSQAECRAPCHVARWVMVPARRNRYGTEPVSVRTKAGWSIGVDASRTPRCNGMAGIHPILWGGPQQVMFGLPVHHPNMLSRPGNSGMLIGFSLPGIHHSGSRTGSTNNRTVGERCWIAISQSPCDPASEAPRQGWACRNGLPGNMQVLGEVRGVRLTGEGSGWECNGDWQRRDDARLAGCWFCQAVRPLSSRVLYRVLCQSHGLR